MPFTTIQESGTKVIAGTGAIVLQGVHPKVAAFTNTLSANSVPLTTTQVNALNNLYVGLVANEIDTKMIAIYPFIGGTATSHKFNLMDPRDVDAAYRLTYNGTITHDSNGITPNGSTGFANTYINISTLGSWDTNSHLSVYSPATSAINGWNIGAATNASSGTNIFGLGLRTTPVYDNGNVTTRTSGTGGGNGCWIGTTTGTSLKRIYRNGSPIATNTAVNASTVPSLNLYIGGVNDNGSANFRMPNNLRFISVGRTLTNSEVFTLNSLIQQYQTILGRAV
jgi:hypothetical protein